MTKRTKEERARVIAGIVIVLVAAYFTAQVVDGIRDQREQERVEAGVDPCYPIAPCDRLGAGMLHWSEQCERTYVCHGDDEDWIIVSDANNSLLNRAWEEHAGWDVPIPLFDHKWIVATNHPSGDVNLHPFQDYGEAEEFFESLKSLGRRVILGAGIYEDGELRLEWEPNE